jgi:putative sigma-54 modulation protein
VLTAETRRTPRKHGENKEQRKIFSAVNFFPALAFSVSSYKESRSVRPFAVCGGEAVRFRKGTTMKITYTGRQVELAPAQLKKLEAQFSKIGKLLDGKRECEAHVILSLERHLHQAEATVNYFNHQLAGLGSSTDLFTAIHSAAEKLEKQAVKARTKWRDTKRTPRKETVAAELEPAAEVEAEGEGEAESGNAHRVHRVNHHQKRKPMTLDEAVMEMEKDRSYLVYRDAETDRISVLVRRKDGDFDLIEG